MKHDRKAWTRPSGTVVTECPRCAERTEPDLQCELCAGRGECGLATAVAWILAQGKPAD